MNTSTRAAYCVCRALDLAREDDNDNDPNVRSYMLDALAFLGHDVPNEGFDWCPEWCK